MYIRNKNMLKLKQILGLIKLNRNKSVVLLVTCFLILFLLSSCKQAYGGWYDRAGIKYKENIYLNGGPYPYHPEGRLIRLGEVHKVIEGDVQFSENDDDLTGHAIPFGTTVYIEEIDGVLQDDHLIILYLGSSETPTFLWLSRFDLE